MADALYSDNESYAAEWLRNLVAAGELPAGDVDERDIRTLTGADVETYTQAHFFAGIGGWPLALHLAGWPAERPVWTGSCPCQPFSCAGKGKGEADERHLWPAFLSLIAECRPATIFGEQVASRDGREWLSGVRADLEDLGYAVGAADLCAAGEGAPHIRQRLWWVADANGNIGGADCRQPNTGPYGRNDIGRRGDTGGVANSKGVARRGQRNYDTDGSRRQGRNEPGETCSSGRVWWNESARLPCSDGKARRTQPGILPLAHGVPCRVGRIRAYGNAIVPQVAATFIRAFLEATDA